ncbi:oligopeptide/dipeptide ABC transporter ATP-binding protein [Bradyrhizobium sp. GM24.11]
MSEAVVPHSTDKRAVAAPGWFRRALDSDLFYSFVRSKITMIAAAVTLLFFLLAIFASVLSVQNPFDPAQLQLMNSRISPLWTADGQSPFLLGTDEQGRDVLSAILYGLRISLLVGVLGVVLSGALGILLGLTAGYFGGAVDGLIMRIADVQLSFPAILIALLINGIAKSVFGNKLDEMSMLAVLVFAIGLSFWVQYARTVRGSVLVEKNKDYVAAAQLIGLPAPVIMLRHVLPNTTGPILVIATINLALAIITEATLSFLGSGMPETMPSLGTLIRIGNGYLFAGEWWIVAFPGIALAALILSINLLGDWLRDALNPRNSDEYPAFMTEPVLSVRNLQVEFASRRGTLRAIDGVSFDIAKGEVLGVVGESGAGKSVTGLSVIGLIDPPGRIAGGEIHLAGLRIDNLPPEEMRRIRGKRIGMIFQDPLTSLNPLYKVGDQIVETIRTHLNLSEQAARRRAIDLLAEVGIPAPEKRIDGYPHEFSGGMRQRVVIALAICAEPELIIADEPTTALDVSVQAQIISLIKRLGRDHGTAVMLVTHDMGVIAETSDRVAVMYAGRVAEIGPVQDVVRNPLHPYAKGLMGAIPTLAGDDKRLVQIPGSMPRLSAIPRGCSFNPRCAFAFDRCRVERPEPLPRGTQSVACHLYDSVPAETAA